MGSCGDAYDVDRSDVGVGEHLGGDLELARSQNRLREVVAGSTRKDGERGGRPDESVGHQAHAAVAAERRDDPRAALGRFPSELLHVSGRLADHDRARHGVRIIRSILVIQKSARDQANLHCAKVFACSPATADELAWVAERVLHLDECRILRVVER